MAATAVANLLQDRYVRSPPAAVRDGTVMVTVSDKSRYLARYLGSACAERA